MFCGKCGAQTKLGQNFCNVCGEPLGTTPAWRPESRMERNLKLLGILWLVLSALRLIPGLAILSFGSYAMRFVPFQFRGFVAPIAATVGALLFASAVAGLIAGWGLLDRRPWARMLAIVLGVIALLHPPFGTALGIYTLWVLLPGDSEHEYRRLSQAA